jgi:transcriptional regulator of met regulon
MRQLNWVEIQKLADLKTTLFTKTRVPFQVVAASEETLTVRVQSGEEHTISRTNLEKAVQKIQAGAVLSGPKDYRDQVADDRPAYAWAILRELGFLK